jgi:hypothetical protein
VRQGLFTYHYTFDPKSPKVLKGEAHKLGRMLVQRIKRSFELSSSVQTLTSVSFQSSSL